MSESASNGVTEGHVVTSASDPSSSSDSPYLSSMSWTLAIGIGLLLLGCTVDNLGITLQKLAHKSQVKLEQEQEQEDKHSLIKSPVKKLCYCSDVKWALGLSLYLAGNIINAVALPMCPQSVYAALGSSTLVINVLTSSIVLKEKLTKLIVIGTCIIIIGSLAAVLFGDHAPQIYSLDYLLGQISRPLFIIYLVLLIICIFIAIFTIRRLEDMENQQHVVEVRMSQHSSVVDGSVDVPATEVLNLEAAEGAPEDYFPSEVIPQAGSLFKWSCQEWRATVLCVLYPMMAGMIGSITLLSAKIAGEIVKSEIRGNSEFSKPVSYLFFVIVLSLGATQIHVLNLGLRKFDQIVVIPVFTVSLETFSIVIGVIFFEEFLHFDPLQRVVFPLAIFVTYFGVYITALGQKNRDVDHVLKQNPPEGFVHQGSGHVGVEEIGGHSIQ